LSGAAAGALAVGLLACAFRYLTISPLENDHFVMLARAQQVLYGDWPVRDFEDPGQPLFYLLTAGAAAIVGPALATPVLVTNIVLCVVLQAMAASCTYVLARRASGSALVGVAAAIITIVSSPRFYNTTKVIVPVVTILVQWRYADMPGVRRLIAIGGWTAVAFLLRHDYAVYVVASTIVLLAVRHASEPREAIGRITVYGGVALLCVSPWLAYVQWNEGLPEYVSAAVRFAASEGRRTATGRPQALYYLFALLPLCGLVLAFRPPSRKEPARFGAPGPPSRKEPAPFRPPSRTEAPRFGEAGPSSRTEPPRFGAAHLASASVLVLMMNAVFLRDVLLARLPDAIAPTVVLAAALMGHVFAARTLRAGALIVGAATIAFAAMSLGVAGYRVPTPAAIVRQTSRITDRLVHASPEIQPSPRYEAVVAYLAGCTAPGARVFVTGFGPQIPFLAGRPFAGGLPSWIPGYYETPADVARARRRLEREPVAAAVLLEGTAPFERSWPDLAAWFRARGFEDHAVARAGDVVRVWLPKPPSGVGFDEATGLPCVQSESRDSNP
jgi:hypothetical protein